MANTLLCIGFGDIAARVAREQLAKGWQVIGMCRQPEHKQAPPGVTLVAGDANNEQDLKRLLLNSQPAITAILVTLTPARGAEDSYHQGYVVPCRHLQQVLAQSTNPPQLIYVSSTGVYGQRDGQWVTEESPTEPDTHSGAMLLQAEQVIAACNAQVSILRCSGIYGPGRTMLIDRLKEAKVTVTPAWTNRIHADDVAGFIAHLFASTKVEPLYLVNDNEPALQADVYKWLAAELEVDYQNLASTDEVGSRGSKRCDNKQLKSSGYKLQYPTFRDGYKVLVANHQD
ncbi:Nucleoside-diphosphate-sugar epimerase [Pseudidiomarina planktonica]|uniref:Nucleoside-diphosphate-sugar epimerase n=1 Tax=Pseudidiomarina planktonica TaxID=1323738 RepID=A0A1Y6EK92_9GAMM|nr:SDR family oxidoreductase [Pseudidiomarina planktonica]RUO65786.1 NAD(P)-dependent oxidoreductase [Pseudidiomarina planktonica]SMQ62796.1 Nucleoside-diphosphate-sugar epimerase [Pseudidiomarina planktonica]